MISVYENEQTFRETENDSLFQMEEADVCELSEGEHFSFRFVFRYKGNLFVIIFCIDYIIHNRQVLCMFS